MVSNIAIWVLVIWSVLLFLAAVHYYREWRRTRTLFEVGLRLNSTLQRKELLHIIMETAAKTCKADGSSIILVDQDQRELYFEVATGEKGDQVREIRLQIGEGIAGWVAATGQSVIIPDVSKDPRWSNRVAAKVDVPTRNMLCAPVVSNGEILGVLQVINRRNGSFSRRDLQLLELIASPAAVALENMLLYEALVQSMDTLRETTAVKQRMESEMKIAQDIQRSFLPGSPIRLGNVELDAVLKPANDVGGDLYHYLDLGNDQLLICLGDVSDKGMPAALFMSGLMIWIQAMAREHASAADVAAAINREVSTEDSTMFATIFLAILDTTTGRLRYTDGGHCTAYLMAADGSIQPVETVKHLPIGIYPDAIYTDMEIQLAEGDTLLLYTDGVTEAENMEKQWFGVNGLLASLEACAGMTPQEITNKLLERVQSFTGDRSQSDDIAVMAVQYRTDR